LLGDPTKANNVLGWKNNLSAGEIVAANLADLQQA
jgi:GDP-D-mannose dehydratase